MDELEKLAVDLHRAAGYKDARAFTTEEKIRAGFKPEDICGVLGIVPPEKKESTST